MIARSNKSSEGAPAKMNAQTHTPHDLDKAGGQHRTNQAASQELSGHDLEQVSAGYNPRPSSGAFAEQLT